MTTARRQRRHPLKVQMAQAMSMLIGDGSVSHGQGEFIPRHGKLKGWQREFRRSNACKNKMKPKG